VRQTLFLELLTMMAGGAGPDETVCGSELETTPGKWARDRLCGRRRRVRKPRAGRLLDRAERIPGVGLSRRIRRAADQGRGSPNLKVPRPACAATLQTALGHPAGCTLTLCEFCATRWVLCVANKRGAIKRRPVDAVACHGRNRLTRRGPETNASQALHHTSEGGCGHFSASFRSSWQWRAASTRTPESAASGYLIAGGSRAATRAPPSKASGRLARLVQKRRYPCFASPRGCANVHGRRAVLGLSTPGASWCADRQTQVQS